MNFFYKAYSVIYLIVGWVMCRFMLLPAHSMKDVPGYVGTYRCGYNYFFNN